MKKMNRFVSMLALALSAAAVPQAGFALGGDIVEIRAVDVAESMVFGNRNAGSPELCTMENPLIAGDEVYFRVRMLVRNYDRIHVSPFEAPQEWSFQPNTPSASLLNTPALGLFIGDRPVYATFSKTGPNYWQESGTLKCDDAGKVDGDKTTAYTHFTDLYFYYKVQAGDIGLPVVLMNSNRGKASSTDDNTDYFLLNCALTAGDTLSPWKLANTEGEPAVFHYGEETLPEAWPTGSTTGPVRNFDLAAEGVFIKTVDFDRVNAKGEPWTEGEVWRSVYPGMTDAPMTLPALSIPGGSKSEEANVVWIWSEDESVFEPVGNGIQVIDGHKKLPVTIPAGAETVTFTLRGADGAAVGSVTNIVMSSSRTRIVTPAGEEIGSTLKRLVEVVTAPEPTVKVFLDGTEPKKKVTASPDYTTCGTKLTLKMVPACSEDVTVTLKASVDGDSAMGSLEEIYDENIIRIAPDNYGGDPINQRITEVTIPKNTSTVNLDVFILGATAKTGNKGVYFETEKKSGPASVKTEGGCTLQIARGTPEIVDSEPPFLAADDDKTTITVKTGDTVDFTLELADTYRNLNDEETGYTFYWTCDSQGDIDPYDGVVMEDGLFTGSAEFYNVTGTEGDILSLYVKSPDGQKSKAVTYRLIVNDKPTTTIEFTEPRMTFCEGEQAYVNLGLWPTAYRKTGYIFLDADDRSKLDYVDSELKTEGALLPQGQLKVETPRLIRFRDGTKDLTLKAVLCSENDLSKTVTTYASGTLSFTVTNKPPTVVSAMAAGQYVTPDMGGKTLPDPISRGVVKTFTVVVDDVEDDLKATGDKAMAVKWMIDGTTYETNSIDNAGFAVKHTFANEKENALIQIFVKDKDMLDYPQVPNLSFYARIKDTPRVLIRTSAIGGKFLETDKSVSTITVELTEPATAPIRLRFKVSQVKDGGYLKIRTVEGSVEEAKDESGNVLPGEYDLLFDSGVLTKELVVSEMDGTNETLGGLDLNARVTSGELNPDGVAWSNFYTKAESALIRVQNVAPEIIRPTEAEAAYTNMNASANVPYPIPYGCNDVVADLATGVVVQVSIDGTVVFTTNATSTAVGSYEATFEGEGAHVVEVSFTDKDQMISRRTLNYFVKPSKRLQLRAHGPAVALGTTGGYSMHYGSAKGLGAGRVYAGEKGPQQVKNFVHLYSFAEVETAISAYAVGYQVGDIDNGSLNPFNDAAIDLNGNTYDAAKGKDYYNYTNRYDYVGWMDVGYRGFDSFLYGWACNNTEASNSQTQNAGGGTTETTMSFLLNIGPYGETVIPLPETDGKNDNSKTTAYPMQYWEAVFSRELFKDDNCGDINLDGVPDIAVYRFGLGIVDTATYQLIPGGDGNAEGDLTDVSEFNKDVDKDGAEDPDYLPSTDTSAYAALIPGLKGTWASVGKPFGARLEIRGYHDGLNDALDLLGITGYRPTSVYAEPIETAPGVTNWVWTKACTISELEFAAWSEFAAANGLGLNEWANADGSLRWSPERPTNPMKSDTDGDGFTDGYEYFFWYRAHVGDPGVFEATGRHVRLTGRRYDPRNPGEGRFISSEEIADLMDPLVKSGDASSAETRDTDNDGLPDLLEFEIGTNPFDFDTDGDGLPDGWELCNVGNLSPLDPASHLDGKSDTERNSDGDAMAISSYALEKQQKPVKLDFEHAKRTTFAVIDPAGDTDGVQWYAVKGAPADVAVESVTNAASVWSFEADGRFFVSTEKPVLTAEGILAKTLAKGTVFVSAKPEAVITNGTIQVEVEPGVTNDVEVAFTNFVAAALYPVRLEAGTPVAKLSADPIDGVATTLAADIKAADANACWIYGKGPQDALYGEVAKTAADYGCLALGRQLAAKKGAVVCALPDDTRDVAFLHYLVYQEFGFDPRTAWKAKDPLATRWSKSIDGEAVEGITTLTQGGYAGAPSRTRDYANYDEFLVYSFFVNNGCKMSGKTRITDPKADPLVVTWDAFTTNPQGPNEKLPEAAEGETQVTSYGRGENGADTDFDGVPDGWELYVMAGPKKNGAYVFAHPYAGFATGLNPAEEMPESYFSPFLDFAKGTETSNQIYLGGQPNDDTLNEFKEFEGTDSIAYYAVSQKEGDQPYSTTVVHEGNWTWFNKFFPTDPWAVDTDQDGVKDNEEKLAFAYGTPADDGKLWSIPGGGLNPCSVDTDLDGLPDGWERQFAKSESDRHIYEGENASYAKDETGAEIGNPLEGLDNCMDGTVPDAYNVVNGDSTPGVSGSVTWTVITGDGRRWSGHVDRDYDHDGLENWQEYLVGTMRCWRYDDPVSPWTAFDESVYFDEDGDFDPVRSAEILGIGVDAADDDEKAAAFWYETLVNATGEFYNPHFITGMSPAAHYFTRVKNVWDAAYLDATLSGGKADGAYYYLKDMVAGQKIADTWAKVLPLPGGSRTAPNKYISCSPIDSDTDCDGMDDYYELFHGLNPLLGASGVKKASSAHGDGSYTDDRSGNACDIVYDAWYNTSALEAKGSGETANYWQRNPWKAARGENGMDFEVFPYLAGLQNADPDGDDIPNNKEFLSTRVKDIGSHTDPTPLWMTDSSYSNSLVRLNYRMPMRTKGILLRGAKEFTYNDVTYRFTDFDGYGPVGLATGFMPFNLDSFWSVADVKEANWLFSFEENEGYDTDHDALGDREERDGLYRNATDPLDADSPLRRSAMYFPGANAALQTMPEVREEYPVATRTWPTDPSFQNFTVECWAKPEDLARDQTVVERAIWTDPSNAGDQEYLRRNFQIAIRGGRWMAKYDSGTLTNDEVKAFSRETAETKWTHLAATFDGDAFRFYVDGVCQNEDSCGVKTLPENGVSAYAFVKGAGDYAWDVKYESKAILVGASFKGASEGGKPEALDVTSAMGWSYYKDFFRGYVDEIRIWDGARTSKEIVDNLKTRYTAADAKANRDDFYDQWAAGENRYALATTVRVIPELRYHFHFDSVPGAADAASVMKTPTGFQSEGGKPVISRPLNYRIDWFAKVIGAYGAVYGPDADWIQWIPNTVAHLPRFDGTTLDSFFWSADYTGAEKDVNGFANTAEPVSRWTQMAYNGAESSSRYGSTSMRHHLVYASSNDTSAVTRYQFTGRHLNQTGDDLLPLGGAFVKYADELWDGEEQGPSTQWEHTGVDSDGNMLPDWYEEFVRANYTDPSGAPIAGDVSPDTDVFAYGRTMKVRELYLIDLARGVYLTEDGKPSTNETGRAQTADLDRDGLPDWWEEAYRIHTKDTDLSVGHADGDPDNDGLSTFQEYLVSRGEFPYGTTNNFPNLNPMARRSLDGIPVPEKKMLLKAASTPTLAKQTVPDYFLPLDAFPITLSEEDQKKYFYLTEYLGEILTDHDFVEDWWENKYAKDYSSANVYDPWDDGDGDGWSTFAECRASLWGHSFLASLIDGWTGLSSDMHVTDYPEPIIGVKVSYAGQNKVSGSQLVIRTKTGQTKRTDATFVIPSTLDSQTRYLNTFEGGEIFHGHLSPGQLNPNSVVFEYARYSSDKIYQWNCDWYKENEPEQIGWDYGRIAGEYYEGWWTWSQSSRIHTGDFAKYRDEIRRWPHLELEGGDLQWEAFAETQQRGNDAVDVLMNGKPIGTIDATTGEFALDMTRFAMYADYREYVFRVTYTSRIGHEWPQTVYVSDTKELASGTGLYGLGSGRVREGQNTIEAFFDFNRNGQYDVGEPYGAVKNVQVGWHKVPEVTIELTEESRIAGGLRTAIVAADKGGNAGKEAGGEAAKGGDADKTAVTATQKVRIVRESINGQTEFGDLCLNERTLMKRDFLMDDRAYLTEADVISAKKPDLDWNYLRKDADKCGILSVDYATYRVESYADMPDGTVSNTVIGRFTREFKSIRPAAAAVSPVAEHPVYSSAPTFRFTAGEDATAFEIQVASTNGTIVYDSGVQMLGGRSAASLGSLAYSFTAPIYAGVPAVTNGAPVLVDGEPYKWRVVTYNAKFNTAAEADFTGWMPFQMDVGNANRYPLQPTGYGRVGAIVRYFGPAKTNRNVIANQIIVEAFATADFTGQAMAQTRVGDTTDLSSPTAPIDTLDSVNALLTGVDTGTVYLRAYIDLNNNGQWDRFEPWGYANMFDGYGTEFVNPPIYNPKGIAVGSSMANIRTPNFTVLYIEDTDWNKNEIPDCTEDIDDSSIWPLPPVDPEMSFEEEDSDRGGAPDDWEDGAGSDSEDPEDEQSVVFANDVMAYKDIPNVLLVQIGKDENDRSAAWYAVMDLDGEGVKLRDASIAKQTDASEIKSLVTTWSMTSFKPAYIQGTEPYVGIGTNVTFEPGEAKVLNKASTTVRLVHAQVYAKYGYDTLTANGQAHVAGKAVNTKPFTVLDKFLVCRYLENIGVADVSETNMIEEVRQAKRRTWDAEDESWDVNETWKAWSRYTLNPNSVDSDRDDVADGWELYVMFGTMDKWGIVDAASRLRADLAISPFNVKDGMLVAPGAGSQLKLVEEFDGGFYPTDPWNVDTDKDGVIDFYAYQYCLKGDQAGEDLDGDGLSNYAEYLISEVFKVAKLDPKNPKTDGYCVDYFRKMGDLYVGEIFTDHDQVDDVWEGGYPTAANRDLYDPNRDDDNDGWPNYAEFRAGTDPSKISSLGVTGANDTTTYTKNEYPIPVIEAKVVYNGNDVNLGKIVFKAWNDAKDPDMTSAPDAIWTIGNGEAAEGGDSGALGPSSETGSTAVTPVKYIGRKPSGVQTYRLSGGSIESGSITVKFLDQQFLRYDSNDVAVAHNATSPKDANWYVGVWDKNGKLYDYRDREVGSVDYDTGLLTIDCGKFAGSALGLPNSTDGDTAKLIADKATAGNGGGSYYDTISLDNAHLLLSWSAVNIKLTAEGTYYLADPDAVSETAKSHGHVREGRNTFICYMADSNGAYVPGAPFGVVRGVDVGWQGAKFTVELSETTAITPRMNLMTGANDRDVTMEGQLYALIDDRTIENFPDVSSATNEEQRAALVAQYRFAISNRVQTLLATKDKVRIRVVRYGIDDMFAYMAGVYDSGLGEGFNERVVMEKEFDMNGRDFLSEADFLDPTHFDIDWGTMTGEIVDASGKPIEGVDWAKLGVTNMTYLVVVGDGAKDFRGSDDTNTTVFAAGAITRRFDKTWTAPRCEGIIGGGDLAPAGVVYTAHPTFAWTMPSESPWAKRFGSSYTAFKLLIFEKNGTDPIYDSGIVRAPAQDAEGRFVWTAPISVGDQTPQGKIFKNSTAFSWKVVMYNSKFQPGGSEPFGSGVFSTSVNTQQPQNDATFSSIGVAVKYTGPVAVLDGCENLTNNIKNSEGASISAVKGIVRVQAFMTADFSGVPASETFVASKTALTDVTDVLTNACLTGLAAGTYYIRAYIDMNGNFEKDEFESWGYAKEPITVGPDVIRLPAVSLYIEDADTNGNWYPDAWEYAYLHDWKYDWVEIKDSEEAKPLADGKIVLSSAIYDQIVDRMAGISTGLTGSKITVFQDEKFAKLILKPYYDYKHKVETTIDAIRKAVEKKVVDKTLKITAITLDTENSQVILAMDAETDYANLVAGNFATRFYDLDAMGIDATCTVTVQVYKKSTLAQEKWELVDTVENVKIGRGEVEMSVPVKDKGADIDPTSGFYMIKVIQ